MGKKKNKFKKIQPRQSIGGDIQSSNAISSDNDEAIEASKPVMEDDDEVIYAYVKKDVKKILLLILLVVILLTAAYFVSTKTTLFQTFGNWIYKVANIQTQ